MAGQYLLKQGDEVAFVLHTNLKSGELNAQRVRRTKEAPEPPPAPGAWLTPGEARLGQGVPMRTPGLRPLLLARIWVLGVGVGGARR